MKVNMMGQLAWHTTVGVFQMCQSGGGVANRSLLWGLYQIPPRHEVSTNHGAVFVCFLSNFWKRKKGKTQQRITWKNKPRRNIFFFCTFINKKAAKIFHSFQRLSPKRTHRCFGLSLSLSQFWTRLFFLLQRGSDPRKREIKLQS